MSSELWGGQDPGALGPPYSTALVPTAVPVRTPADWEARAAFWASRVLFWAFEPTNRYDPYGGLDNAMEGMRDSLEAARETRKWTEIRSGVAV